MNILAQLASIPDGARHVSSWLGDGGEVVEPFTAQARSEVCKTCAKNDRSFSLTSEVASAVRKVLEVKNDLSLRVEGEEELGVCGVCLCQLKLLVHMPQKRVEAQMTEEEKTNSPAFCWKIKP